LRLDGLLGLELAEDQWRKATGEPAIAIEELVLEDCTPCVLDEGDEAALCECMKHPLFVSGNVHLSGFALGG
jgi:hypothetical protein